MTFRFRNQSYSDYEHLNYKIKNDKGLEKLICEDYLDCMKLMLRELIIKVNLRLFKVFTQMKTILTLYVFIWH